MNLNFASHLHRKQIQSKLGNKLYLLMNFFPELVMSTDLLSFEHPSVLLFCFIWVNLNQPGVPYHLTMTLKYID